MSKRALIKSASVMSAATLLSRVLGFVRDCVIARTFGTGWLAQAFFVAFRLPNMFRELAAEGASNAALVPVFSAYRTTEQPRDFWKIVNTSFLAFTMVLTGLVALGMIFSPVLVQLIAPGFVTTPEKLEITVQMNTVLFGYLLLISIAAFMMGVSFTFKSFLVPSLSPSIFNIVSIIAALIAANSIRGVWILVYGTLLAGAMQIAVQIPPLLKNGFRFRTFEFDKKIFANPAVKKIGKLFVPRILGTAVYQLNVLIDTMFASLSMLTGQGAIAAIYYANRLIQFPLGLFGHSISNAALPTLSEHAARGQMKEFAETVQFSILNMLFVIIPASFGLVALSHPIIKVIFERGVFDQYSTSITSTALTFYAVGLAGYGANKFLAICFNALHDTMTPVKISTLALVLNVVFIFFFVFVLKTHIAGLAFASSLSATIATVVLYRLLHRRVPEINSPIVIDQVIRIVLVSILMTEAIMMSWQASSFLPRYFLRLFFAIIVGVLVYCVASFYAKISQAKHLLEIVLRKKH